MLNAKIDYIMKRDLNDAAMLREAAVQIEVAFAATAENAATPDQLADLADAIDAFKDRSYGVAAALARAAAAPRRPLEPSRRPASMARTLADLRAAYERLRAARAARVAQPKRQDP